MIVFEFDVVFFFFKQKTAYEMRISDWSSDVCSSDRASGQHSTNITHQASRAIRVFMVGPPVERHRCTRSNHHRAGSGRRPQAVCAETPDAATDRKRVVWGQRGSVRVALGGSRAIQKKKTKKHTADKHKTTNTK